MDEVGVKLSSEDIRVYRDSLVSKRALHQQQMERSQQARDRMKSLFSSLAEEDIESLEKNGVYVRELLSFDLDKVMRDKELSEVFQSTYKKILAQMHSVIESKKGVI